MSIDTVERYLQELEAIKNYPQVKREKEELSHKIESLFCRHFADKLFSTQWYRVAQPDRNSGLTPD